MTIMITRCPECETSFRVSDAQLGAAGGVVRCGACLEVFRAMDHRIDAVPAANPPRDELEAAPDGSDCDADVAVGATVETETEPEPSNEAETWSEAETGRWAEGETEDDHAAEAWRQTEDEGDPSFEWQEAEPDPFEWRFEPAPPDQAAIGSMDFGRAAAHVDEGAIDRSLAARDESFEPPGDLAGDEPFLDPGENGDDDLEPHPEPFLVESDPDELVAARDRGSGLRLRWWAAAAFLVFAGGTQYLWFERDRLAQDPRYREDWLEVCRYLPCDLPPYREPDKLSINGLIVRTHGEVPDALRVDALLANDARYSQAFPHLHLRFSDLDDTLVASRVFSPSEYLGGEMSGIRFIPGNTEVRVTIEINDPGREAVSYRLDIL